MIVAITGTPGTGKSTVSKQLRGKGYQVLDLNQIVLNEKLITGYDKVRDTSEVDLERLNKYLIKYLKIPTKKKANKKSPGISKKNSKISLEALVFLEGHIAHLLDILDIILVLRCHPTQLRQRLKDKAWSDSKLRENLEAEALDVISIESVEKYGQNKIFEIDTTSDKPAEVAKKLIGIVNGKVKGYEPGNIDWSEEILKWY